MSYAVYKLIHFFGMFTMVVVLVVACSHALRGGTPSDLPHRRALLWTHGLAAFLVLLGGFGMLARLGVVQGGLPGWIYLKLSIWLALAASVVLPKFGRAYARALLVGIPLLAVAAGAVALYKPL